MIAPDQRIKLGPHSQEVIPSDEGFFIAHKVWGYISLDKWEVIR